MGGVGGVALFRVMPVLPDLIVQDGRVMICNHLRWGQPLACRSQGLGLWQDKEVPSCSWIPGLKIETGGTQWWYKIKRSEAWMIDYLAAAA